MIEEWISNLYPDGEWPYCDTFATREEAIDDGREQYHLSVKITYHVDMSDLSKKLSNELDELLLQEIVARRGYVKEHVCHDDGRGSFRCDRCGVFVSRTGVSDCSGSVHIRYCPNCGAKVVSES